MHLQLKNELERLDQLKKQNLQRFVLATRAELHTVWDKCMFGEQQRREFSPAYTGQWWCYVLCYVCVACVMCVWCVCVCVVCVCYVVCVMWCVLCGVCYVYVCYVMCVCYVVCVLCDVCVMWYRWPCREL